MRVRVWCVCGTCMACCVSRMRVLRTRAFRGVCMCCVCVCVRVRCAYGVLREFVRARAHVRSELLVLMARSISDLRFLLAFLPQCSSPIHNLTPSFTWYARIHTHTHTHTDTHAHSRTHARSTHFVTRFFNLDCFQCEPAKTVAQVHSIFF